MANEALARIWAKRLETGNKAYAHYSKKYKIEALRDYYEGRQWEDGVDGYVINMFYSTIETKMPTLLFDSPKPIIKPKPQQLAQDPDAAFDAALNLQDALWDWADETDNYVQDNLEACLFDAFFSAGICEIDYSADWVDNPKARKPLRPNDSNEDIEKQKKRKKFPAELPRDERVYIRYIPSDTFRTSSNSGRQLTEQDWCAWYEFFDLEDLKTVKGFTAYDYNSYAVSDSDRQRFSSYLTPEDKEYYRDNPQAVLVWKIIDIRNRKRICYVPGYNHIAYERTYQRFPLRDVRFRKPQRGFWPLPVTYNWVSPQNELNEVREQARLHRRRYKRAYIYRKGSGLDDTTMATLVEGEDGSFIGVTMNPTDMVAALPNADLGSSHFSAEVTSQSDFNVVSGVTAAQRAQTDRQTATASNIEDERAGVRESREKNIVTHFYAEVFKAAGMVMKDQFVNPMTVSTQPDTEDFDNYTGDPSAREVDPITDFGGTNFDFDVTVQITSVSSVANEDEKRKLFEFLAVLNQYPQIAMDPAIVHEVAFRIGYRNVRIIKRFMDMAQLQMIGQIEMGKQQMAAMNGGGGAGGAQATVAQQTPNSMEQIRQQLGGQLQ